jgi:hypothetical protein
MAPSCGVVDLALLAVKRDLDRVFALRRALCEAGLCDPGQGLARLSVEEVAQRLAKAGYVRADYMNKFLAARMISMAASLSSEKLKRLTDGLQAGGPDVVEATLAKVKRVGPSFLHASGPYWKGCFLNHVVIDD